MLYESRIRKRPLLLLSRTKVALIWGLTGRGSAVGRCWLDLDDAERAVGLFQVKRRPVPGAQPPFGLKRHRDHLLDQLPADRVADRSRAEEGPG